MDFKLKKISQYEGTTAKGSIVTFPFIKEKDFHFLQVEPIPTLDEIKVMSSEEIAKRYVSWESATRFHLHCNFQITTLMINLLESSKIVFINGYSNRKRHITIYPLFGFTWEKFTDILHDLSEKFEL